MLDILSLTFSVGIQTELDEVRKNTTQNALNSAEEPVAEASTFSNIADAMDSAMSAVENTVSDAVSSVITAVAPAPVPAVPAMKKA